MPSITRTAILLLLSLVLNLPAFGQSIQSLKKDYKVCRFSLNYDSDVFQKIEDKSMSPTEPIKLVHRKSGDRLTIKYVDYPEILKQAVQEQLLFDPSKQPADLYREECRAQIVYGQKCDYLEKWELSHPYKCILMRIRGKTAKEFNNQSRCYEQAIENVSKICLDPKRKLFYFTLIEPTSRGTKLTYFYCLGTKGLFLIRIDYKTSDISEFKELLKNLVIKKSTN